MMSNFQDTSFDKKCEWLAQFYLHWKDIDGVQAYRKFLKKHDLGVCLALLYVHKGTLPTDEGLDLIENAWQSLLDVLMIDGGNYDEYSIEDFYRIVKL
jgi:hypothetical protein